MAKRLVGISGSVGLALIILLAGCAGEVGLSATPEQTAKPSLPATDTAAPAESESAPVEPMQADAPASTSEVPAAGRPLLTAPVVELPRIIRDVTPEGEQFLALVLDPVQAGVPVMPGAVSQQKGAPTVYQVGAQLAEVEAWYQQQMTALGWRLENRRVVTATSPGGEALRLDFSRDKLRAVVMLEYLVDQQVTQVSLRLAGG